MTAPNTPKPILAMIALSEGSVDANRVEASLRQWLQPVLPLTREIDDILTFSVGDELAAIGLMPKPIPWSDLEGPCATAWYWPEATEAMKRHTAHLIVALSGGRGDVVERHLLATRIVAAMVAATSSSGVYWGSGTVVNSPEHFLAEAGRMDEGQLPLGLWVDFRIQRLALGATRGFTTGLAAFGHMEIEAPRCRRRPSEVWELLNLLADHVLTSGETFEDGDTFGRTADERIIITYASSMWDRSGPVMRLKL